MMPIHEITTQEYEYLRSNSDFSRFRLAFFASNIMWQGRINQEFSRTDYVSELTWDTETLGDWNDIIPGMTLWIGSAAGLSDIAKLRLRKAATAVKLFFDPASGIAFANNLYLTIVDDVPICQIPFAFDQAGVPYGNTSEAYTNQNTNYKPVVIMGGHAVVELVEGVGSLLRDASLSWVPGGTISSYSWECSTASAIDDDNTATPTFYFDTVGTHLISLTVVGSNGVSSTRYQKVYVWDINNPAAEVIIDTMPFTLAEINGAESTVRIGTADAALVQENAHVALFAVEEAYGDTFISLGQSLGNENILLDGWIVENSIEPDFKGGYITFTIRGNQQPILSASGQPVTIERVAGAPANFLQLRNPTLEILFWQFITWRSTLSQCMDCFPPDATQIYPTMEAVQGTLAEQLNSLGDYTFSAWGCDLWGRLFMQRAPEMLSDAEKDDLLVTMEITRDDRAKARIEKSGINPISIVFLTSIRIVNAATLPSTLYSVAPGLLETKTGRPITIDTLASDQAESNSLAGRAFSAQNSMEQVIVELPQNNRLLSVFPQQQKILVTVDAEENPAGVEVTGYVIIKSIRYIEDRTLGVVSMEIRGDLLVPEGPSADGKIPLSDGLGGVDDYELPVASPDPDLPLVLLPELPELPALPNDSTVDLLSELYGMNNDGQMYYTKDLKAIDQSYWIMDPDQQLLGDIRTFVMTPDGHIYLIYKRQIYWATIDNPKFSLLFGPEFLEAQYPGGFEPFQQIIAAYGVSPIDPNKLLLIMGSGYTGSRIGHFWSGDHTGVTQGVSVNTFSTDFYPHSSTHGTIRLVDGNWLCTYGTKDTNRAVSILISIDGSSVIDGNDYATVETGHLQAQSANESSIVYYHGQSVMNELYRSADAGLTHGASLINPVDSLGIIEGYTAAASPSATRLMVVYNNAGTPELHASNDSGTTFSALTLPPSFEPTTIFNVSEDIWVVAGREDLGGPTTAPLIYMTDDFGITWFPKYGDLPTKLTDTLGFRRIITR